MDIRGAELSMLFDKELEKPFVKENKNIAISLFSSIKYLIRQLPYKDNDDKISIELTSDSICIVVILNQEYKLFITKPYSPKEYEFNEDQVVFSLFKEKRLILSNMLELNELVKGINKFMKLLQHKKH